MPVKYQLLADRLREELSRNSGQTGYKLPTEQELSQKYRLSRQTVRHALRLLAEEGLIQRRQGSGSYATGLPPGTAPRQIAVTASFLDDYISPAILHDASDVFSRQGYSTAVYATENRVDRERDIQLGPVPITSLSHRSRIGRTAAEQMADLLRGESISSQYLEWELAVRKSG